MIRTIKNLAIGTALVAATAMPAWSAERDDMCRALSNMAEMVMTGRQQGMSVSEMLNSGHTDEGPFAAVYQETVIAAYRRPRYATASVQQREVESFRDDAYVACLDRN